MSLYQMIPFNNTLIKKFLNWKQSDEEDNWRNKALDTLVKKLKKNDPEEYKTLELVLREKSEDTPCIALPRSQDGRLQVSHRKMLPQVMYCRIFRWPDLQSQHELKSLPRCQYPTTGGPTRRDQKICVNPYHYARVDHSLYPPVVTPRNDSEFTNASPPPQSPLSPSSTYSHQQGSPTNYFQQMPQPAHEHNNPYNPIAAHTQYKQEINQFDQASNFSGQPNFRHQHGPAQLGFAYSNQSQTLSENYFGGVGPNGEPMSSQIAESPQAHQPFDSQTPPPRYSDRTDQQQSMMGMDGVEDVHHSSQSFNGQQHEEQEPWCRITYAELNQKIGEPFKSSCQKVFVDGYTDPSIHNRRFSLGVLSNINRNSTIEMTRRAIRRGICLENIEDQIFVQNLSESSIFFHSKNCNVENQLNHHAVVKIEPGKRQKIFDPKVFEGIVQEARMSTDGNSYERLYSLTDHCVIKMSFVKGWGSIYQRQDVTSTPCWIEICLLKPYALLDRYLQETRPIHHNITSTS